MPAATGSFIQRGMAKPVVVVGIGELGGVFARGLLRRGHPVYPVTRDVDLAEQAAALPDPELVLVSVGEAELDAVLASMPAAYLGKLVLVQNELLPRSWQRHRLPEPTLVVVWFEKKPGMDVLVLLPSAVFGPAAQPVAEALEAIGIPTKRLASEDELLYELVRKNLYILVTNLAGLKTGGSVAELRSGHPDLVRRVASEVLAIQEGLVGGPLPREKLMEGLFAAFDADPNHKCTGRSAPGRLKRALGHAHDAGLDVPELEAIAREALAQ